MRQEWVNWSENLRFVPRSLEQPDDEQSLVDLVRQAADDGRTVRVVGAGHSMPPLVETPDILVSLEKMTGLVSFDGDRSQATLKAGTKLEEVGTALFEVGLAMENIGDVDYQALAGAIGTGTHGTGRQFGSLSSQVIGLRMVIATGEIVDCSPDQDPDLFHAAVVGLGTIGIFTRITLRLLPTFRLHRREWCVTTDECLDNLDQLAAENRRFDFYWYPRRDEVKIRTVNPPDHEPSELVPDPDRFHREQIDWSHKVLPRPQQLKFIEMEYALPEEAGRACFQEVRKRIKERHRKQVAWRLLYRYIAKEEGYLSNFHARDSVTIALLQNAHLPYEEYFFDIEPIFRCYGGRPHWGKLHRLKAADLAPLYPMWHRFQDIRRRHDPNGLFLNSYVRELLEED